MKKDFVNNKFAQKQTSSHLKSKWRWIAFTVAFTGVTGGAIFYFAQHHQIAPAFSRMATTVASVQSWITERRTKLSDDLVKVKRFAANQDDEDQEIHFEFYTALPTMQINEKAIVGIKEPVAKAMTSAVKPEKKDEEKRASTPSIVSAEQLQRELENEFAQKKYVVQFGVFKNAETAERYRTQLVSSGLSATVQKIRLADKDIFRVQSNPFLNADQAKAAQRLGQEKNLNGIIRKVD